MGIDTTSFNAIMMAKSYITSYKKILTLGRQCIHIGKDKFEELAVKFDPNLVKSYDHYCDNLYRDIGFESIDSMDYSGYEGASILQDLNKPFLLDKKYDFIYDGGTTEHVFNISQAMENIINLLEINGIYCSVTCNNNYSGHGFYQFSPEFFLSIFKEEYGMSLLRLYIAEVDSLEDKWIDVKNYGSGRNTSKFDSTKEVYIIAIAKKISNNRQSFQALPPQQNSYQNIDWKNSHV